MTDQNIAFVDCETTSLRPDRRAWEIAVIFRQPGQPDHEQSWMIEKDHLDLGEADLQSLKVGGFFDRHGQGRLFDESTALSAVEQLTRGAILMGSNPSFDAETLATRMRFNGICPSWHYHLEDVPTLATGWLYGRGDALPATWKSDAISLSCGVDPAGYERHTALGDCRWMRDLFDVVTGKAAGR
jgi:hypothetical protein